MIGEVEVCAGDCQLSTAMARCGYKVKAFDAPWPIFGIQWIAYRWKHPWPKVRYSKNHDFLRTIGFISIMLAVGTLRIELEKNNMQFYAIR